MPLLTAVASEYGRLHLQQTVSKQAETVINLTGMSEIAHSPSTDRIVSRIESWGFKPLSVVHRAPSTIQRN